MTKPIIVLDLDGVIANFVDGACAIHGYTGHKVTLWDWYKRDWGMTDEKFWEPIKASGKYFYDTYVSVYSWSSDLIVLCKDYGSIVIATNNPFTVGLASSKTHWIQRHCLDEFPVFFVHEGWHICDARFGKELLAAPNRILIDDADHNVDCFSAAGGKTILFPQPWNRNGDKVEDRLGFVEHNLRYFTK